MTPRVMTMLCVAICCRRAVDAMRGELSVRGQALAPEDVYEGSVNGQIKVKMHGQIGATWWGTEHMGPVMHASQLAKKLGQPCVVVEAGAHKGSVAIVAAKAGCEVYAFEASKENVADLRANMKLNDVSEDKIHVFEKRIGEKEGERIQDDIPSSKRITLLKMDLDGPDPAAMRGATKLFDSGRVDLVNMEFWPKQYKAMGEDSTQYLHAMHKKGFNVYLLDCYALGGASPEEVQKTVGPRCLNIQKHPTSAHFQETEPIQTFLTSFIDSAAAHSTGVTDGSELGTSVQQSQMVHPSHFQKLDEVLGPNAIDLILRRRQAEH